MKNSAIFSSQPCCLFDFRELALLLICKWRWIGACILTCLSIGVLFCLFRTPFYQSQLLMLAQSAVGTNNVNHVIGLSAHTGISGPLGNNRFLHSQQKLINSRRVLMPVIRNFQLDLSIKPRYFPFAGHTIANHYQGNTPAAPWLGLKSYSWGGDQVSIKSFAVTKHLYFHYLTIIYQGKQRYTLKAPNGQVIRTNLKTQTTYVFRPTNNVLIKINISRFTARPGVEFKICQYPPDLTLEKLRGQLSVTLENGSNILMLALKGHHPKETADLLNAIAKSAIHYYTQHTTESARKALLFLYSQLPTVHTGLTRAETALSHYQAESGHVLLHNQAKLLTEKLYDLESQMANLDTSLAKLRAEYTNKSFQVRQAETALNALRSEKSHIENQLKTVPTADQKMTSLIRQAQVQNETYTTLLNQIQYYELVKSSNIGALQVVDPAISSYLPSNMHAIYIVLLYLLLGIVLGCVSFIVQQYFQGNVLYPQTAAHLIQLPLVCVQYRAKDTTEPKATHRRLLSEMPGAQHNLDNLRLLRTNLIFEIETRALPTGMISLVAAQDHSANSFTAANLAQTFADTGRKTLVIDADLKAGNLHQYFDMPKQSGFKGYLKGEHTLSDIILPTRFDHLDFIGSGKSHLEKDLLLHPNCQALVEALSQDYDIVIFDLPALTRSPQSLILARYSNLVLLNVSAETTNGNAILKAKEQLDRAGIQAYGCTFNKAYWPPKWLNY